MTDQNNLPTNSAVKNVVMSRVRAAYVLKMLMSTTVASCAVFILALWGVGREVWVSRVFQNMPSVTNLSAVTHFYLAAFMDTRFIVQVLLVLAAGAFVWFVYNAFLMLQQASLVSASRFRSR